MDLSWDNSKPYSWFDRVTFLPTVSEGQNNCFVIVKN